VTAIVGRSWRNRQDLEAWDDGRGFAAGLRQPTRLTSLVGAARYKAPLEIRNSLTLEKIICKNFSKPEGCAMVFPVVGSHRRLPRRGGKWKRTLEDNLIRELRQGADFFIPIGRNPLKSPDSKK
jgi:hypothetical protein